MNEHLANSTGPAQATPELSKASPSASKPPRRGFSCLAAFLVLAPLSMLAGFVAARFQGAITTWLKIHPVAAADSRQAVTALVSAPKPGATAREKDSQIEEISRLAPQQQAERLLELAVKQPDLSLGLIRRNLTSWRGHLEDTDHLFHLVLAALDSNDPRVRVAAVEVDLAANNLIKAPESVERLERQIRAESHERYLALWRLGALGNRGVEPSVAFRTLRRYAHDRDQEVRYWAVEGLAMLGNGESIEMLLEVMAHDPAMKIRERAANGLSRSGLLTGEQRLAAVPELLNLLDDDSLNASTQNLVGATLEAITGASFGTNAGAWREWWAHHDSPGKTRKHVPANIILA